MDREFFLKNGYIIAPAERIDVLEQLRDQIFEKAKKMVDYNGEDATQFFNQFHHYELTGTQLNDRRFELYNDISKNLNAGELIYQAYEDLLTNLVGPDILVQKGTNLVIQQPGDSNTSPVHRDSPLNSPFEVVGWVPLVDIYATKGMYVLNLAKTDKALELLSDLDSGYEQFQKYTEKEGTRLEMKFGEALFFWPGLVHGIPLNQEKETRWSLNIRYKGLFSPVGSKGLGEFFQILRLSPLAQVALEHEKEECSK